MTEMNIFTLLGQATGTVKLVISALILMSIGSWSIIVYKLLTLSKARKTVSKDVDVFLTGRDLREAIHLVGSTPDSVAYMVAQEGIQELQQIEGLNFATLDDMKVVKDSVRRALRRGVNMQIGRLAASLPFLATCANAAPFIGLFGTVWGIMHSFQSIGQMKTAALATVAPGISEALIATAIGLAVAIPATVAYNFFMGQLSFIEAELINFAGAFLNRVQRELPGMSKASRARAAAKQAQDSQY